MLDLAKHIVTQKTADFEPETFEDHYEAALTEPINQKRSGKAITSKPRPKGVNVVDLMDALKRSISGGSNHHWRRARYPRKAVAGQREMLLPISGKRATKEDKKKPTSPHLLSTHPTSAVLSEAWYFVKRVTLSLALRSSGDAGRGFGRIGAAAALVAG